jgi:hypothetical protein
MHYVFILFRIFKKKNRFIYNINNIKFLYIKYRNIYKIIKIFSIFLKSIH